MTEIQELTEFLKLLTAETDRKFRELSESQKELSESQKELSEEQRIRSAELDQKFAETDRELKETARMVKELTRNINGIADSNGLSAEQYFISAIEQSLALNGVSFDYAEPNKKRHYKNQNIRDQYDLVLYNPSAVGIVEIKHRLRSDDVKILATRKVANFRLLFPDDAGKSIYLAAAGLSVDAEAVDEARKLGVYVMTQAGEGIKILNDEARVY